MMKRLILTALLALLPIASHACDASSACLNWSAPTTNVDGTPLTDLAGYDVVYGTSCANKSTTLNIPNPATTTVVVTPPSDATWCFAVKAYNAAGARSAESNTATKTTSAGTLPTVPAPPSSLKLAGTTVYQVLGTADGFTFLPVGTAPASTACIPTQEINGYYAIPRASVTWYGSVKPQVVVAKCSG